jgi:hypothetical protein
LNNADDYRTASETTGLEAHQVAAQVLPERRATAV